MMGHGVRLNCLVCFFAVLVRSGLVWFGIFWFCCFGFGIRFGRVWYDLVFGLEIESTCRTIKAEVEKSGDTQVLFGVVWHISWGVYSGCTGTYTYPGYIPEHDQN